MYILVVLHVNTFIYSARYRKCATGKLVALIKRTESYVRRTFFFSLWLEPQTSSIPILLYRPLQFLLSSPDPSIPTLIHRPSIPTLIPRPFNSYSHAQTLQFLLSSPDYSYTHPQTPSIPNLIPDPFILLSSPDPLIPTLIPRSFNSYSNSQTLQFPPSSQVAEKKCMKGGEKRVG